MARQARKITEKSKNDVQGGPIESSPVMNWTLGRVTLAWLNIVFPMPLQEMPLQSTGHTCAMLWPSASQNFWKLTAMRIWVYLWFCNFTKFQYSYMKFL